MSEVHTERPLCPTCFHAVEPHDVLFDAARGIVAHNGQEARLTRHEFIIAEVLLNAHPKAVNKDRLFDAVYAFEIAEDDFPEPKIIDVFVCKTRKKLSPIGVIITTEWGYGYGITLADPELAEALKRYGFCNRADGMYRRWQDGYDEILLQLAERKAGLQQIARTLNVPYNAVQRAMQRLGVGGYASLRTAA